jgi:hypothetical protein
MHHHAATLSGLVLLSSLAAQSIVVPNANATTRGTTQLNSLVRNQGFPRTYQYGINASELIGIPVGSVLTGISLRFQAFASNTASWPPADITWSNYDIWAGPANPIAGWVADPMANFAAPPLPVRTGPMTLDAGSFTNANPPSPTPNAWSEFYFDFQVPYLWLGGDLALMFSHPGSNDPATAQYPEVVASNAAAHGAARVQNIHPPGTATAGTNFYVLRLHYGYGTGCPGSNNQTPVLVQNADTTGGLGGTINLQIANTLPNNAVALVFGLGQTAVPLPNGCLLQTNAVGTLLLFTNANGRALHAMTIPAAVQAAFHVQGAALDAGANGGYALTNGVSPVVQ